MHCSDPKINTLLEVGAYTVLLCMNETHMDCCTRERALWTGDAVNEQRANYYTFYDPPLFVKAWKQVALFQSEAGRIYCPVLGKSHRTENRELPVHMMHFVTGMKDYALYTGDIETVKLLYPYLKKYVG